MKDIARKVLLIIKNNPRLLTSSVVEMANESRAMVEDAIWELWSNGEIQIEPDSTLRVTVDGERVFRHFYP